MNSDTQLAVAKEKRDALFQRKSTKIGVISGFTYGIMGAVTGGLWYWQFSSILDYSYGIFIITAPLIFLVFNDTFAALFLTVYNTIKGRGSDLISSFRTKPGKIMMLCGIIGGPIGQGCYYMGFGTDASGFAGPLSALYCMFGVVLGYFILHQVMNKRIWAGVAICVIGAIIIGVSGVTMLDAGGTFYFGIACFLVAAVCWGLEGTIAAYGTPMIDPNIAINIRFIISAFVSWVVFVGVFAFIPADGGHTNTDAFVDMITSGTFVLGIVSGCAAAISYLCWYKANNMGGVGKGMALNITYAAWTPIISAIIIMPMSAAGYFAFQNDIGAWPIIIVGVIVVLIGAILVSVDPRTLFGKRKEVEQ